MFQMSNPEAAPTSTDAKASATQPAVAHDAEGTQTAIQYMAKAMVTNNEEVIGAATALMYQAACTHKSVRASLMIMYHALKKQHAEEFAAYEKAVAETEAQDNAVGEAQRS